MRKLRLIRPWRLRAVRLRTANVHIPSIAESVATSAPGGFGAIERAEKCRGIFQVASMRNPCSAFHNNGPRGERVGVVLPRSLKHG